MNFKLDENLPFVAAQELRKSGYNIHTVIDEELEGVSDSVIYRKCQEEKRCIITMDLDFSDVTRFPPHLSNGIVIIRPPKNVNISLLQKLIKLLLYYLSQHSPYQQLWIVEMNRIRIYQPE